ncbi:hypothetical protein [Pectobacterium parmentieri]|uniref:hypothetical protein n=1 Tax=Pectobacterium parmentieri TaxID=1905730 RepID=UPI000CDD88E6|nr:hypothetical protein [Pectobacterium parmentieri]AYH05030.1 hypothetical protein C5E25_06505 [Pectobacterium parmentieri]AYH13851.1 hypothetical protein C5E23_06480 [Pectobacterium parmentieri]AYH22554.1 hypothetical protein C5E21_06485 [Pectobacterium parmentieri]POW25583.1 hypothetical protein PB20LOC_03325 [Pectobacterium parmentieri]QPK20777.1 hypothetical protein PB20LOC_004360 [Pectobacterium parmentieri]
MSRYDDISNYYYNENSAEMDVKRYLDLLGDSYEIYLEELEDNPHELFFRASFLFSYVSLRHIYYYSWQLTFKNKIDNQMLCDFIAFESMGIFCEYASYPEHVDNFKIPLSKQGSAILSFLACHRNDIAEHCYPFILDGLKAMTPGKLGELEVQKLGILAVEMLASEKKQTIDWDSMEIPFDKFYSNFVREALYSKDGKVLTDWLTALCDNHLKWSARSELVENESPLLGYEISEDHQFLWPFEYQAIKNFRAKHGLSTPDIDHPLLKTPMAINHHPDFNQWKAPEWFYPLLDKLIAINPKISFVKDLFK